MYKISKYRVKGINSEDSGNVKSCLEAKFSFRQETAPKDIEKVKKRTGLWVGKDTLHDYLIKDGFSEVSGPFYKKKNKQVWITPYFFNLGFYLNAEAKGEVPRKEMFDLDALNHFILTGEIE